MSYKSKHFRKCFYVSLFCVISLFLCVQNNIDVHANDGTIDEQKTRVLVHKIAEMTNTAPVDTKFDRIWKAIPGLNGIEVDEEATYRKLKKHTDWDQPFTPICKQIPPNVKLEDLQPVAPIFRGNDGKKQIALMVNVAWGEEYLPSMLETLRKEGVKATFFFDGTWLSKHHDMAQTIAKEGHDIGNHGYHHLDMDRISTSKMEREIIDTNSEIYKALGRSTKLFAPPSGAWNQKLVEKAAHLKMYTILWTLDTVDWRKPPASIIIQRIVPRAQNGAMVLMHPTAPTAQALRTIITALKAKGYELVTVTELISPNRPEPIVNLRKLES
jgi:probable sporulation protein (polysaccharide deacetylase family)